MAEVLALMFPPVRWMVSAWMYPSGSGPSAVQRKKNFFEYRTLGVTDAEGEKNATVEMGYAGDAYKFTALSLVEAAVILMKGETEEYKKRGRGANAGDIGGGVCGETQNRRSEA